MTLKEKYEQAKANANYYLSIGNKEKADKIMEDFRGDEISKRLSAYRSSSSQTALVTNLAEDLIYGRTTHFEEAKEWASIRERVKAEVDAEIAEIEGG
jgi:hypothetical protein